MVAPPASSQSCNLVHHLDGQADDLGLVGNGTLDRLLDRPSGVCRELATVVGVKTLDSLHWTKSVSELLGRRLTLAAWTISS